MSSSGKDDDRSKRLLSDAVLPRIEIPRSGPHRMREFKLPEVVASDSTSRADKADPQGVDEAADPEVTMGTARLRDSVKLKKSKKRERTARDSKQPRKKPTTAPPASPTASGKGSAKAQKPSAGEPKAMYRPATSEPQFRARTMSWFDEGDSLGDDEPEEFTDVGAAPSKPFRVPLPALLGTAALVIIAVLWLLSQ